MTEDQAKYEPSFEGSDQVKAYVKKLDDIINIDLAVIDRHLDISYDYAKYLPSVEGLENERTELGDKALWSLVASPEAYNESISGVTQKAEKLISKLESLQRPESEHRNVMKHPNKIISGGQTGVDRAGLDAAMEVGLPVGGYVPKGRLAEDGKVPDKYPMTEMGSRDYKAKTKKNVLESDGTLIINIGPMKTGTALTAKIAQENNKPLMIVQLDQDYQTGAVLVWLNENLIEILNIAGPRESKIPGIHDQAKRFLLNIIK